MTAFLAALPAPDPDALAAALAGYGAVDVSREGPLAVAVTGSAGGATAARCVLDGELDNLEQIAEAAGIDPALPVAELLPAARDRIGEDRLLALLRGSFALLLWDAGGARAVAVRDQVGERGVVWTRVGACSLVACEAAELVAMRNAAAEPDEVGLAHWLALGAPPGDRTLLRRISRLLPGHALELTADGARVWRYWRPPSPHVRTVDRDEAVALLRARLTDSVVRQARPATAVLLSGGIDSSTVAAFGAHAPNRVNRAYSAVFPVHPSADETSLIELTARTLELDLVTAIVRGGSVVVGSLPYFKRWLLPCATPNLYFWLPLLRRAVADGTVRMLDGEAGDALFGLAPALLADRLRAADLPGALRLIRRMPGADAHLRAAAVVRLLLHHGVRSALPPGPARLRQRVDRRRGAGPEWLRPRAASLLRETSAPGEWKQPGAPRWWSQMIEATILGPGPALAYDDIRRRDGLVGITSRHPLADVDLLELVLSLPPELAFDARHSRPLLRAAVAGLLPDEVRLRAAKSHFGAPFYDSLSGPDLAVARELLGPDALIGAHVDLAQAAAALLGAPPPAAGATEWTLQLWRLLTAELWLRTLADREFPDALAERYGAGAASAAVEVVA